MLLIFKITFEKETFDEFYLHSTSSHWEFILPNETKINSINEQDTPLKQLDVISDVELIKKYKLNMDGYLISLLHYVLRTSVPYRSLLANHILNEKIFNDPETSLGKILICINIIPPHREMIDYKGNEMFEISCRERQELDNAMAWLSTLGGAFSALGDYTKVCATIAGKISERQLQIAIRLGDPYLVARCKLYIALSLIQKHKFKQAKNIIRTQYLFANQGPVIDTRLKSMCLGIWSKLKYDERMLKANLVK